MSNKIIILVVEGTKLYKCIKCGEMSKRRYNTERHFRRFHENIYPGKTCCGTTFCTKSDFYDHKEKTHNEKRKYTKGQNQSISESDEVEQEDTIIKSDMEISETRNNNELGLLPIKKYFLHKWQKNSFYKMENNRAPLTNMENME
ncbi:PREDICTED: uncharacterized protein LOC105457804 isoform X2 [Wasmannia auropunctata]|uniref:uncharacterized protein LOC105457804 isoform X2 n=1 Tax=Wasmannia auropunctata TaxID=64793 RepID=UPI0005EE1475|nr:PREDICTED: uncharacterized protein LOC105457804 isoform X2 [Wasmannia auropunctata]